MDVENNSAERGETGAMAEPASGMQEGMGKNAEDERKDQEATRATAATEPKTDKGEELTREEFETLIDRYSGSRSFSEGDVVTGRILQFLENEVIVDIGYKSEGLIDLEEFRGPDGEIHAEVGQEVDVLLERAEDTDGYVVLSKEKAEKMKIWDRVEKAYATGEVITGRVLDRIKGGLSIDIGVRAFLPGSLVDVRPVRNLESLKGDEFRMKVIKVNKRRGNIVLSRKAVIEEENAEKKKETIKNLEEGAVMAGVVKNLTEYGAFVDLGGIDGLLHITDMSWGRINHPSEMFKIGDDAKVVVLKFDRERERVSLGYKQLQEDPWTHAADQYPPASRVRGKVVSITDYGAFVELEEGIEGLIHVSEMSWTKRIKHPTKLVNVGDEVDAVVLEIDQEARRLSLGLKQIEPNPWDLIERNYAIGDRIKGTVRNLTDFGAFVEVAEGVDGLVHISDLTWNKRIKHPSEVLKKGDEVEAVILKIDSDAQRLSLGVKQLMPDAWDEFFNARRPGDVVMGKIVRLTDFGVFVELMDGVEGLVHVSELADERVEKPSDRFETNQEVRVKILRMDPTEKKIGLSIRAAEVAAAKAELADYKGRSVTPSEGIATLGEVAQDLMRLKAQAEGSQAGAGEEPSGDESTPVAEESAQPGEIEDDVQAGAGEEPSGDEPTPAAKELAQPGEIEDDVQAGAGEEPSGDESTPVAEETEPEKTDDA